MSTKVTADGSSSKVCVTVAGGTANSYASTNNNNNNNNSISSTTNGEHLQKTPIRRLRTRTSTGGTSGSDSKKQYQNNNDQRTPTSLSSNSNSNSSSYAAAALTGQNATTSGNNSNSSIDEKGGGSSSTRKSSSAAASAAQQPTFSSSRKSHQPHTQPHSSSTFSMNKNEEFHFDTPLECPVFRPTVEEFKNPLAYISKIRPIAEKCGIAKVLPPESWSPPFAVDVDKLKFTPRVQRLNELEAKTRVKLNFLDQIAKFWELQGSSLKIPMVERKALDLYTLHRIVQEEGGMDQTTKERKWAKVANRMSYPSSKSVGATLKAHYERILHPFNVYTSGKVIGAIGGAAASDVKFEDGTGTGTSTTTLDGAARDYKAHEIVTRQQIVPPNETSARRSKRFANSSANCGLGSAVPLRIETKEDFKRDLFNAAAAAFASGARSGSSQKKAQPDPLLVDPLMKYICHICNSGDDEESMLLCDGCDDSYHTFCLLPKLTSIPQGEWLCPRCVVEEVSKPTEAFGFEQAEREYTLQQFGQMADQFKADYFRKPVHLVPTELVEREFWRIVSSIDEDVTVEYGADLHTMDHGSGFPTKSSLYLLPGDQEYAESSWNLNNLPLLEDSILGHINADISGMNAPWMYVGMCFAAFCWHNEDHWSYSINYLHWGEPKTWYGVPGNCAEQFEETMKKAAPELFASQPDLLHQLVTIMNPNILMNNGVPVFRTDQNAGEFVITFPRAYHAGFNQGYNFAEAVNFAPADWLKMGRECVNHYSILRRFCVFSHDELVCKMALEPAKLTFGIATACYIDMAEMVDSEKKLRKSLLEWGVTRADRKAFELIPDDERHCQECNTTCFLSAVSCECTKAITCLRHYTVLCTCVPDKHTLLYRYTLDEMPLMLQKLKAKAQSFERWLSRCRDIVDANTPTVVTLAELQELTKEAEIKKFPSSLLIDRLNAAVLEAEKCVTVIQQLGINKVRTRSDNSLEAAQYKLTMEELELFVQEIDNLCCIIEEGASVRELLVLGKEFVERTKTMIAKSLDKVEENDMVTLMDEGSSLRIELHQMTQLSARLKQLKWYKRSSAMRNASTKISHADAKQLIASGQCYSGDVVVDKELRSLQQIVAAIDAWEKTASKYFRGSTQHELPDIEQLLETANDMDGQVPSYGALKDAIKKARDWLKSVEQLQANDHFPYCHTLEAIVQRGRNIPIQLEELARMQGHLNSAHEWKENTARAFLKKQTFYTLLEVLMPRSESVIIDSDLKKPFEDDFVKDMNPAQIVDSFKIAEEKELRQMRELRRTNMSKNQLKDEYCLCKSNFQGVMINCQLCKDWFHEDCVSPPPSTLSENKSTLSQPKYLCPSCVRSKRPRLETILPLLVSLQRLPIRLPEDEALRCLAERAMNWQDRARKALTSPDNIIALEVIATIMKKEKQNSISNNNKIKMANSRTSKPLATYRRCRRSKATARVVAASGDEETTAPKANGSYNNDDDYDDDEDDDDDDDEDEGRLHIDEDAMSDTAAAVDDDEEDDNCDASNNSQTPTPEPLKILSETAMESLADLMMEGDLLEVSLDESNEIWRIIYAANPIPTTFGGSDTDLVQQSSCSVNSAAEDSNDSLLVNSSTNSNSNNSIILSGGASANAEQQGGRTTNSTKKRRSLDPKSGCPLPRKKTATPNKQHASAVAVAATKKAGRKSDGTATAARQQQQEQDNAENHTPPTKQTNGNGANVNAAAMNAAQNKKRKRANKKLSQRAQLAQQEDDEEECRAENCHKPTGREVDWVQCDGGCNEWFHMYCVGLCRSQIKADDDYICIRCSKQQQQQQQPTKGHRSQATR